MDLDFEIVLELPRLDKLETVDIDRLLESISAP